MYLRLTLHLVLLLIGSTHGHFLILLELPTQQILLELLILLYEKTRLPQLVLEFKGQDIFKTVVLIHLTLGKDFGLLLETLMLIALDLQLLCPEKPNQH